MKKIEGTEGSVGTTSEENTKEFLLDRSGEKVKWLIDSIAAKVVAKHLSNKLAFDSKSKTWLVWAGTYWKVTQDSAKAVAIVANVVDQGCGSLGYKQHYLNAIVRQIQLTGLLKRASRPLNVVAFNNGLLDIKTGELRAATPEYSTDSILPHNYDERAKCPNIKKWLLEAVDGDIETHRLLRAWLAALIRGLPLQYVLMLIGRGGSGKGVFQRLAVATIGELNTATSTLSSLENNSFETAKHYGKSLALINEAGTYKKQLNMLKAMSGGDHIPLEKKHQQQNASFVYGGLFLLATNVDIASSDSGIERRRVAVRFSKQVTMEERRNWQQRGGEESVLHSEIPGLIRWLLQMRVADIYEAFENLPERVIEENLRGMRSGSSVADWMLDECYLDPKVENQMGIYKANEENDVHLYPAYRLWCDQNGRQHVAGNLFKNDLFEAASKLEHQLIDSKDTKSRRTIITGICLNSVKSLFSHVPSVPSTPANSKALEGGEGTSCDKISTGSAEWLADYDKAAAVQ